MANDLVAAVKERVDIVDVVRRYVDLRPVSGRWMGPCPFHQETKPSFSVNGEEGFYYCFGCQAAGDVLDFYQRINGLDFRDALAELAEQAGLDPRGFRADPQAGEKKRRKKKLLEAQTIATEFFRRNLAHPAGAIARDYLQRRGLAPEIVERFQLGWAVDDWRSLKNHLSGSRMDEDTGVEAGLLSKNDKGNIYDRFRARLIFPIQDLGGRVVAFGGRIVKEDDDAAKYINSSDTPVYKKGEHLYGLYQARPAITRSRRAMLTEGYMDVLSLHQFGFTNACGVLGTALTRDQVKRLAGFCSRVELLFDGDEAGRKAALKSCEMILAHGTDCRVTLLPEGEDVDSLLQAGGAEAFQEHLEKASDGLSFCASYLTKTASPKEIIDWAKRFLSNLADNSLRAFYLPKLASGLGLSEAELRQTVPAGGAQRRPGRSESSGWGEPPPDYDEYDGGYDNYPPRGESPEGGRTRGSWNDPGVEAKDDRYYLNFAVRHLEYVPALGEAGVAEVLATGWGVEMWAKLATHFDGDTMAELDSQQKAFFANCRMEAPLEGETLDKEWEFLCSRIYHDRIKAGRESLKLALKQAQEAGDMELTLHYLKELSDSFGRDDE